MRVQYVDLDGDSIDVSSENEWREMLRFFKENNVPTIKLSVSEGKNKESYFKDGQVEIQRTYVTGSADPDDDSIERAKEIVPDVVASLFPTGIILPHFVPVWLEDSLKIINLPNNEVDMDINIKLLITAMHRKGISLIEEQKYEDAAMMFQKLTQIQPENCNNYYNLACCYSLLRKEIVAIFNLRKAVKYGYKDWSHMEKDVDLLNIMHLNEFAEIVNFLKNWDFGQMEVVPENQQEKGKEETVEEKEEKQVQEKEEEKVEIVSVEESDDSNYSDSDSDSDSEESAEASGSEEEKSLNPLVVKWFSQIHELEEMGFGDRERLAILFEEHQGNGGAVVDFLLSL